MVANIEAHGASFTRKLNLNLWHDQSPTDELDGETSPPVPSKPHQATFAGGSRLPSTLGHVRAGLLTAWEEYRRRTGGQVMGNQAAARTTGHG